MTEQQITETTEEVEPVVDEELPTESGEKSDDDLDTAEGTDEDSTPSDEDQVDDEQDTFPRDYVEKLRDENARYRQRAQKADDLAERLQHALVAATDRLMDPSDLEFDESYLDDPQELAAAIDELLQHKPYLAKRKPTGNVGQGESGASGTVDLAGILRSRA